MPSQPTPQVSKSGAVTSESGERHIPSSTRPDGSVRKEIRIRPGYRPPEDVEVYKNRTAQAWKERGKGGVPGADAAESKPQSAAANKNAKRREARKKAATTSTSGESAEGKAADDKAGAEAASAASGAASAAQSPPKPADPEADKEKEAKKLTKKLRQARDLKDKKDKGDALLPEQFEKIIKINELIRQLDNLGFDADGEKKQQETT